MNKRSKIRNEIGAMHNTWLNNVYNNISIFKPVNQVMYYPCFDRFDAIERGMIEDYESTQTTIQS